MEVGWEQAGLDQRHWLSDDSISWRRSSRRLSGSIAIDGSLRGVAGKYAACDWAVVQMDHDGGLKPWYGVGGNMPLSFEVQRTRNGLVQVDWAGRDLLLEPTRKPKVIYTTIP